MKRMLQFVTLFLNQNLYGIDIRLVNYVSKNFQLMPVPLSEDYIRGLVNIRGQVILVLDLSVLFGYGQRPITMNSHLIVLKTERALLRIPALGSEIDVKIFGDKPISFLADDTGDVISAAEETIEIPTQYINKENFQFLSGVVKAGDRLLTLLDMSKVLRAKL